MALNLRGNFTDIVGSTMLPLLHKVIKDDYDQQPDMIPNLYRVEASTNAIEQTTKMSYFGVVPQKTEGADMSSDIMYQGYDKTYTHLPYGLSTSFSKEMIEDQKFIKMEDASRGLSRSMHHTRQLLAAVPFNNAFTAGTYAGPDGVALCSTAHLNADGSTQANTLAAAADISVDSLRSAINLYATMTDERGNYIRIRPKYLLHSEEDQFTVKELLNSEYRPDNANMAYNAFTPFGLMPLCWEGYLSDKDSWFLLADARNREFYWFQRNEMEIDDEINKKAKSFEIMIYERFSAGFSHWVGLVGVQGA